MLRGQPDLQKLVAETTGQARGEHHTRPRTSSRWLLGRSARTAEESQGIRYIAWLAEGLRARRLEDLVLDALPMAQCDT